MFLTATNLYYYLRDAGLVDADDIVERRFAVTELGRRNRNFSVHRAPKVSLFVKQIPILHPELIGAMQREAACSQLASGDTAPTLAAAIPRLLRYDPVHHVLVSDFLTGHQTLSEHAARVRPIGAVVARELGLLLGAHHLDTGRDGALAAVASVLKGEPPWVLRLVRDRDSVMPSMNPQRRAVVDAIQRQPVVSAGLDAVRAGWRRSCLIHGDIKAENVMVAPAASRLDMRLIDWELADVGEPLWDVACALVLLVQARLLGASPADIDFEAPTTLAQSFWSAYAGAARLDGDLQTSLRLGALIGGRLILLTFELLPDGAPAHPMVDSILTLARTCFADPIAALSAVFGIEPSTSRRGIRLQDRVEATDRQTFRSLR